MILPSSSSPLSAPVINPITRHLSLHSDLYVPISAALKSTLSISSSSLRTPTKKQSSKYTENQQFYASLFQQSEAADTTKGVGVDHEEAKVVTNVPLVVEEEVDVFTTNRIYNLFVEERREQMREERDRRVEREIEKDREKRGGGLEGVSSGSPRRAPNSLTRVNSKRGERREEKRRVEFDRVSDMMIQVRLTSLSLPLL
jgi:hypothetical protein